MSKKSTLHQFFENVYCINLKRRPDRRVMADQEFNKHGIKAQFISGVDGLKLDIPILPSLHEGVVSKGDMGCTLSHLKVVKMAKRKKLNNYFVFEDDVQLHDKFNEIFPSFMASLPSDWHMLYLGGNHDLPPIKIENNDNICKLQRTFTTHAFAANETVYDALIAVLSKNEKVDVTIATLHSRFNCYVTSTKIAWQKASYSDILEKHTDYAHLRK